MSTKNISVIATARLLSPEEAAERIKIEEEKIRQEELRRQQEMEVASVEETTLDANGEKVEEND